MTENPQPRLYGVSIGNGNDGVSQLYPRCAVTTADPYALARLFLADQFIPRRVRAVLRETHLDGEAEYTVSATLYDPPGKSGRGWCDANGAYRIVEVFPITEEDARGLKRYDGIASVLSSSTLRILRRMGETVEAAG